LGIFKRTFFLAVFTCALVVTARAYCSQEDDLSRLQADLRAKGVSGQFINETAPSAKRMISAKAKLADIETVLMDLWNQGVRQRALKNALSAVAELVDSGDDTLEASRIASEAAHKAEAEGLSGFGVGMRVKKAVQQRKEYLKKMLTTKGEIDGPNIKVH